MLARAFSILEPMFVRNILPASGHGLLANEEGWTILLETLPEAAEPVKTNLLKKWSNAPSQSTPAEKWSQLKDHLQVFIGKTKGKDQKTMTTGDRIRIENWPVEAVFRYTYPRLDINVSKMQNHLLKSPFCVHPKTGRVCVPIDDINTFDPFSVPTLPQLMRELDEYEGGDTRYEWQKTSLKESFQTFEKTFLEPMTKELRREQRAASEKKAAVTGDF
jgi:DNA primase small subunit